MGALLYFAMPDRVDKLIITGSGTSFNTDEQLVATLRAVRENFGPLLDNPTIDGIRTSLARLCHDPKAVPEEILPVLATAYAQPWIKASWAAGLEALMDIEASRPYRISNRLPAIKAETLVLWGREDKGAIYESAVRAVAQLPRAQLYTFEKCGHKPMFEHPKEFNEVTTRFMRTGLPARP
jgi:pimeloyl-ACP methyl ester carboxylesterase